MEGLMVRHASGTTATARRVLGDASLAEDAVQEAFLRVVRRRQSYVPARPFASWFYTILRNVCVDMLRGRARRARLIEEATLHRQAIAPPRAAAESPDAMHLLGQLPDGERNVLVLRIIHELPFHEVAESMGISEDAAKKRAQRGLRRLRDRYRRG